MKKVKVLLATALAAFASMHLALAPAKAFGDGFTYDWIVDIETAQLKNYFQYKGATLKDVVQAKVTFRPGDADDNVKSTRYEDFWYSEFKPLGLDRYKTLDKMDREHVAIRIRPSSAVASMSEAWASANATLRIMLDVYRRGSMVTAVYAPAHSFSLIANAFQQQGFYPLPEVGADQAVQAGINIRLLSEPEGMAQTLALQ
jgi:hypothetical protein